MRQISEIKVRIKRGFLPHFMNELYKSACELKSIEALERFDDGDLFLAQVLYADGARFGAVVEKLDKHTENFGVESVRNILEENILGGLIMVTGKTPVETRSDFEMMLQGAADLVVERLQSGQGGAEYSSMGGTVGMINCVRHSPEKSAGAVMALHTAAERDCVVLRRFAGINAVPLMIRYSHVEDLVKILKGVQESFAVLRILSVEETEDSETVSYLASELTKPVIFREYDEIPVLLSYVTLHMGKKKKLHFNECNVGFIGLDLSSLRLARIFKFMGFARVLGCDNNEKVMMNFEKEGGLATTQENIFSNSDIIILLKNHFTIDDLAKVRPGQVIVSLIGEEDVDSEIITRKGIRDYLHGRWNDLSPIFPGLVRAVLESAVSSLGDGQILGIAGKIADFQKGLLLIDVFGDIHEVVAGSLRGG